jgi:CBS domain containing-hemolysin-like protein
MIWFLLLVSLALSFALSGLESAIIAVSRVRVRHAAAAGDRRAARLLPLIEDREALLGAITVANHITNLTAFFIIAWRFVHVSGAWGYLAAFVVALPVFLILLEVLPKKLFRRYPFRSIRTLDVLVRLVGVLRPLFRALRPTAAGNVPAPVPEDSAGREDLRQQAGALQRHGHLSLGALRLIERALDFRKLRTVDVMTPLKKSVAISAELPLATAAILAREHGATTMPVLGETGEFVGVLDLAALPEAPPPDRMVRHYMRTLDSFREQDTVLRALQRMRKRGRNLALVLNDRQEPVGLLSEANLLHRLMGIDDDGRGSTA